MTRSAVTPRFQARSSGALLVMAHPYRSARKHPQLAQRKALGFPCIHQECRLACWWSESSVALCGHHEKLERNLNECCQNSAMKTAIFQSIGRWASSLLLVAFGLGRGLSLANDTDSTNMTTTQKQPESRAGSNTAVTIRVQILEALGVRHSRIATDAGLFVLESSTSGTVFRFTPVALRAEKTQERAVLSTEAAEAINAEAMRDYQRRFEVHLRHPRTSLPPVLYPTQAQRMTEATK
jgi:uncharacterized protein (DUF2235 family)